MVDEDGWGSGCCDYCPHCQAVDDRNSAKLKEIGLIVADLIKEYPWFKKDSHSSSGRIDLDLIHKDGSYIVPEKFPPFEYKGCKVYITRPYQWAPGKWDRGPAKPEKVEQEFKDRVFLK